jgi:hypothetical protein
MQAAIEMLNIIIRVAHTQSTTTTKKVIVASQLSAIS